jgi:DNA repair protein RecO (recombination protein O)
MRKKDTVIVLHRINYSNSSLVVNCYTKQNGRQSFLFQGGKKKSAHVFPLSMCEISYYHRSDGELGKISDFNPLNTLLQIQLDPVKSSIAFFWADIIRKTTTDGQDDPAMFDFLNNQIVALNKVKSVQDTNLMFLLHYTQFLGIEPQHAGNKKYFNLTEGVFTNEPYGAYTFGGDEIDALQQVICSETENAIPSLLRRKILDVLVLYFTLHLPGLKINQSLEIIRETLYDAPH